MIAGTAYGLSFQHCTFAFGVQLSGIPKPNPNKLCIYHVCVLCVSSFIHLFDVFDSESKPVMYILQKERTQCLF